jgi:Sigma-70 factor, region 1.1/Sigma-70 factor, region 1.2
MTKAKKPAHDDSQIEEIDLSLIDLSAINLDELTSLEPTSSLSIKEDKWIIRATIKREKSEEEDDIDPIIERDFDDAFDDDEDDAFDDDEDDEADESGGSKKKDSYKAPKDFLTDKRRQKTLKKFIDVTVPPELLEGMTPTLQLLIKKGKAEGRLVYDEVITALPPGDDIEMMDEVFSRLAKLHIELVDSLDQEEVFRDAGKKKDEIDLSEISDDSIRMYLNEIWRFHLIDAEEEVRLGHLIQQWDQEARKRLAEANLRLVVSIAKKYMWRWLW